jgi:acyl carrier protein
VDADRHNQGDAAIEDLVRGHLAKRVGADLAQTIPGNEQFHRLGIDSLDIVVILAELERECGVERIANGELWEIAGSVRAMVRYLSRNSCVGEDS